DGLITAIMVMSVMIDTNLPLSALAAGCEMYPQVLKNVEVDDKDGTLNDPAVKAAVEKAGQELGGNGRVLLRKSGTEPVLRVMSESLDLTLCNEKVDDIIQSMKDSGHFVKMK
ncbi:MAG: phosphoglucosamine mutase, partial [Firmicutes bacterium]|nr:phosphoglucosamine mutase [Bacillota bacterium]